MSIICFEKEESDPYLAQPGLVKDFLVEQFLSKDKFKSKDDRVLRSYIDFYTENIDAICKQLSYYLDFCYREEVNSLAFTKEITILREVGDALDHRGVPTGVLGHLLTPLYWYVKYESMAGGSPYNLKGSCHGQLTFQM